MDTKRIYAEDRLETEECEMGTVGCAIDHSMESEEGGCECW